MRGSVRNWCLSFLAIAMLASCSETPVELPKATTINVAPGDLTMTISDVVQVTAQVVDQNGAMMSTAVPLWSSDKPAIVSIVNAGNGAGTVTAMSAGKATLTA